MFGFPRALLERVEAQEPVDTEPVSEPRGFRNATATPTLNSAREAKYAGDTEQALWLYRRAVAQAPDSVLVRLELADFYVAEGELFAAQGHLEQSKRIEPGNGEVRAKLGDVYYARGRTAFAIREWHRALEIAPSSGVLYKLKKALRENTEDVSFNEAERPNFVIRYDGAVDENIGTAVAAALDREYYDLARELRFSPRSPIPVTIYTSREFHDAAHAPSWASALNDGEIRIPVEGVSGMTTRLTELVRHELTHSFVRARTQGNCPSWFHEGLAQMREGRSSAEQGERLRLAKTLDALVPLWSLEGPLTSYSRDRAVLAYAESLSAVEYLMARKGRESIVRILELLGAKRTMDEGLKEVVGLDYQQFQMAWEADLTRYRSEAPQ